MDFSKKFNNLGSIYSKGFKLNLEMLIDKFSKDNTYKNSKLCFYSYHIVNSGYKLRETSFVNKYTLLNLSLNGSTEGSLGSNQVAVREPENLCLSGIDNIESLNKILSNKHADIDESIEREYKRNNGLGEYSDPGDDYSVSDDFYESLDSDVFVDIINL